MLWVREESSGLTFSSRGGSFCPHVCSWPQAPKCFAGFGFLSCRVRVGSPDSFVFLCFLQLFLMCCCACWFTWSHHTGSQVTLRQEETPQQLDGFGIFGRSLVNDIAIRLWSGFTHLCVESSWQQALAECERRSPYE